MWLIITSFVGGFKVFSSVIIAKKEKNKGRKKKVKQLHRELISFIESKHPPTQGPRGRSSWHLTGRNKWADTVEKPDRATRMSDAIINPTICASVKNDSACRRWTRRSPQSSVSSDILKVDWAEGGPSTPRCAVGAPGGGSGRGVTLASRRFHLQ